MSAAEIQSRWAIVIVAVFQFLTAVVAWRTHIATEVIRTDVRKVELATNSMKDALVAATDKAAHAEGKAEGKLEQKADQTNQPK